MVYANPKLSSFELPQNEAGNTLFECYRGGRRVAEHNSGDIVTKSNEMWQNHFSRSANDITDAKMFNVEVRSGQAARPVFMAVDLETPLGFTSFLSNASNHRKVFIPSTFNMSKILKSVSRQESHELVCDSELYTLEAPGPLAAEYKEKCS
jgi:hypothetical protein